MKTESTNEPRFAALLAAVLLPGLGHVVAGERLRGLLVGVGVLGLFFGGMLIGGIDTVDSKDNRVWFIGQALVGPVAFGVDWVHQDKYKAYDKNQVMGIANKVELERLRKRSAYPNERLETVEVTTNQGRLSVKAFAPVPPGTPGAPPNRTSVGKVNELGTLCSTIAGMLNLIAIIDAGFPGRPKKQRRRKVGLQTEHGDAEAPLDTLATVQDPHQGGLPGAKP
jgi:hypothetical protein